MLEHYIQLLNAGDLEACVALFAEDAKVAFRDRKAQGRDAIRQWHEDRFANRLEVRLDGPVESEGDAASAPVKLKSDRAEGRRLQELPATVHMRVSEGRIAEVRVEPRVGALMKSLLGLGS
jgi:ketosteroid isomerase-like protein